MLNVFKIVFACERQKVVIWDQLLLNMPCLKQILHEKLKKNND